MLLKIPKECCNLLSIMVRVPNALPLRDLGIKPYVAKDKTGQKQLIALKRWVEEKVMEKAAVEGDDFKFQDYEGAIPKAYVDRLVAIMDQYEQIGRMASVMCEHFAELYAILKGKEMDEIDDLEALAAAEEKESSDIKDVTDDELKEEIVKSKAAVEAAKEPALTD